jgi:hypothetical protein
MSYFADMGHVTPVAVGDHVRAVGWLHLDHPDTQGEVSAQILGRLREFVAQSGFSAEALYFGAYAGIHTCEFCGRAHGVNNFGVLGEDVLFVAPEMVVHYVERHSYRPPAEFIAAVLRSPLPATEEYQRVSEPYWHLHKAYIEKILRDA